MFKKLLIATLSSIVFLSANIFAVGLGDIEQFSGLNQPLKAEIKILSPGDLAEYEVVASIASQSAFDKSGIDKPFFLNKVKFKTVKNSRGELVIKVTTHDAVKEPFLNFLIELNTPAQQFYREYTLLLDPPIFEEVTASTIEKTVSQAKPKSRPKPETNNSNRARNAEPEAPQASYTDNESETQSFDGSQYGPVTSNDTLWSIASRVRPNSNVSIHQTLVAIYRANPDAFYRGNINNLLRGKVLDIPSEATIQNVPQRAALQDVVLQNRQWRTGGARNIVDQTSTSHSDSSSGNRGSRLSLATANADGNASGYGSDEGDIEDLQNELVRTQEQSATLQAENDELRARLADILAKAEKSQQTNELGVEIADAELALLAKNEQDDSSNQIDDSIEKTADTEVDTEVDTETGQSDSLKQEVNESVTKTEDKSILNPKVPFQEVKPKKESFLDSILDSGELLWGGIAAIVVIILLLVFWIMKKRMEDDGFQDDLVASTGAGSMDTTEVFELPDVGDDMLVELDMDDDDDDPEQVGSEAFDPLGEADIYIAYGKIDQAETLLLEAIEDNPIRSDYKVKLMECYAESDNKESFEKLEAEVKDAVDADEWSEQISLLRNKAWENESDDEFDLPSTEDIFGDDDDDFDIDLSDDSSLEDDSLTDEDPLSVEDSSDDLDLDFGDDEDDGESIAIDDLDELDDLDDLDGLDDLDELDEIDGLELDELDELDELVSVDEVAESSISSNEDDEFSLDLDEEIDLSDEIDLSEELSAQDFEESDDELTIDIDDNEEVSLDIDDDFDFAEDDDESIDFGETLSDEIATKLDLARAYVDMGDVDGAKEILAEVIADGTEQQKSEAQVLMDKC